MPNKREQNPVKMGSRNKVPRSFVRDHKTFKRTYANDMKWLSREENPRPKIQDVGF